MKKSGAIALAGLVLGLPAWGQGTVDFKNYYGNPLTDPAVYFVDGITRVFGAQYEVGLFAGPSAGSLGLIATTRFLTLPGAAGYFYAPPVAIPGIPGGGTAFICIKVWDETLHGTTTGATYDQALAYGWANFVYTCGHSGVFAIVTGNPNATPPGLPARLVPGLTSFRLDNETPEPSAFALVSMGGAAFAFRLRYWKREG